MILYYVLFGFVAFGALSSIGFKEPRMITSAKAVVICALFWLLSFSRWRNGTDWAPYIYVYKSLAQNGTWRDVFAAPMGMEPGYTLLNLILGWADSYHFFLMVAGLLIIGLKLYRILDLSSCATLSCLIYLSVFIGDIFFVRQAIAISICFFAIVYLIDRRPKHFIASVLLASMFHYSALVFLVALPLCKGKPRSALKDFIVLASATVLSTLFLGRLIHMSVGIFVVVGYLADRLQYLTQNDTVGHLSSTGRDAMRLFAGICVYFFFLYRRRYVHPDQQRLYSILLDMDFIATLIICTFSMNAVAILRFAWYFSISELLLFPLAVLSFRGLQRQVVALGVVLLSFVRFWILLRPYYHLYVPYNFFGLKI